MEPVGPKIKVWLKEVEVLEVAPGAFRLRIELTEKVWVHLIGGFQHQLCKGDMIPLLVEIPYNAEPDTTSVQ